MRRGGFLTAVRPEGQGRAPSGPLVSVVVPTYNYGRFIGETLDSLRAQTYTGWECVVVDDGSTDDTEEVVARVSAADARVRYLRQANQRQAVAKNTGLKDARGKYVQFLDADDLLEPLKLERQVEFLEANPAADIVYGGARYFTAGRPGELRHSAEGSDRPWMPEVSGQGREVLAALLRRNIMPINAPLVRRRAVEAVGFFDETLPRSQAEDWDYWLRCALAGLRFQYDAAPGTLALVRTHPASSSRDRAVMYGAMLIVRKRVGGLLSDPELLKLNREMASADEGYLGIEEAAAGNRLKGMGHLVRAAALERKTRWRMKWLSCALAAPFVSGGRLRALAATSLTQSVRGARRVKSGSEPT